jgi:hypothetical protein
MLKIWVELIHLLKITQLKITVKTICKICSIDDILIKYETNTSKAKYEPRIRFNHRAFFGTYV